jgi:RecB family exonuclease
MPITRKFLGFRQPALHGAVDILFGQYCVGRQFDLSQVVLVLPGRRAGRRLLEVLVSDAARRSVMLVPPRIVTVGSLPEELYVPQRPFADELVQSLAWAHVLRAADPARLRPLLPRGAPEDDLVRWRELGDLLRQQHLELAADGLNFQDVVTQVSALGGGGEQDRWQTLARLQSDYLLLLDGLELWDRQTARLKAIEFGECATDKEILLLGTVDMTLVMRKMLDEVADCVTALVFAESSWADRFDAHGCLVPEVWKQVHLSIDDERLEVVGGAGEQADAVVRWLRTLGERYAPDEVTVGVADESLVPDIARRLQQVQVASRWGPGTSLAEVPPIRLLQALADFVQQGRFADFAALVRHPDIESWIGRRPPRGDWLVEMDRYQAEHLPYRLPTRWLGEQHESMAARQVAQSLQTLVAPLRTDRPLNEWPPLLSAVLLEIYGHRDLDQAQSQDRGEFQCFQRIREAIELFESLPDTLVPTLSSAEAIRWLVRIVSRHAVAAETEAAVELLGWLELPLDDAPALAVTSLNEGFVPQSVNTDLFLPNALRTRLGLLDNDRRLARDAYALQVLFESRKELRLIAGRRSREGDPLVPSRLLFATAPEAAARRALEFFQEREARPGSPVATISELGINVPRPQPLAAPIDRFNVTSFRDYLACPYRYYLRHVLRLESMDDHAEQMHGGAFGSLAHEVVRRFAESPASDSTTAAEIRAVLHTELDRCLTNNYGRDAMPAVQVQAEQLRLRLNAFAEKQAAWASDGWQIAFVESGSLQEIDFAVDDQVVTLRGRIDRMDVHREDGRRAVLDYKTSNIGKAPSKVHQRAGRWVDLQLPLYRQLATTLPGDGPVELGYVLLPKDPGDTQFALASWSDDELDAADEVARDVIRRIRAEEFWPPAALPPAFSEEFGAICQDRALHG